MSPNVNMYVCVNIYLPCICLWSMCNDSLRSDDVRCFELIAFELNTGNDEQGKGKLHFIL